MAETEHETAESPRYPLPRRWFPAGAVYRAGTVWALTDLELPGRVLDGLRHLLYSGAPYPVLPVIMKRLAAARPPMPIGRPASVTTHAYRPARLGHDGRARLAL